MRVAHKHIHILVIAALGLSASAAMAANANNGAQLAKRWCASCHVVDRDQKQARADVRPFAAIARKPDFTPEKVAFFLLDPHPKMPEFPAESERGSRYPLTSDRFANSAGSDLTTKTRRQLPERDPHEGTNPSHFRFHKTLVSPSPPQAFYFQLRFRANVGKFQLHAHSRQEHPS
jgi:hypothetical protein